MVRSFVAVFSVLLFAQVGMAQYQVCPNCGRVHQYTASTFTSPSSQFLPSNVINSSAIPTPVGSISMGPSTPLPNGAVTMAYNSPTIQSFPSNPVPAQQTFTRYQGGSGSSNFQMIAQSKASRAAARGYKGHLGGSLFGAGAEGVGFSTISAADAIARCCHSGDYRSASGPARPRLGTGVARGPDGWYACILCQ